jgi:hypothetical protein
MEAVLSLGAPHSLSAGLTLPMNCIALDENEMEYVDGGTSVDTIFASAIIGVVSFCIGWASKITGQSFARNSITVAELASAFSALGSWAAALLDSVVAWAWMNPEAAAMCVAGVTLAAMQVLHSRHLI